MTMCVYDCGNRAHPKSAREACAECARDYSRDCSTIYCYQGIDIPDDWEPGDDCEVFCDPCLVSSIEYSLQVNGEWADMILDGEKTVETSGQALTRGGAAPGWVYLRGEDGFAHGAADLKQRFEYLSAREFAADVGRHRVPTDSEFAFGKRARTWGFPIRRAIRFDSPVYIAPRPGQNRMKLASTAYRTSDGFTFYHHLREGRVTDNLDENFVDMSWQSLGEFLSDTDAAQIRLRRRGYFGRADI